MKKYIYLVLAFLTVVSCQKELVKQYVNLQYSEYSVNGDSNTFTIGVESNSNWKVSEESDWVEVSIVDDKTLSVTVQQNNSLELREAAIKVYTETVSSELIVKQSLKLFDGMFADLTQLGLSAVMSHNGKFAAGTTIDTETYRYVPVIMDLETGEMKNMDIGSSVFKISSISDDGSTLALTVGSTSMIYRNGEKVDLEYPSSFASAEIISISSDGNTWVGNLLDSRRQPTPAIWENGVARTLPMPKTNPLGGQLTAGIKVRGASSDCSVIYGFEPSTLGLVYWVNGNLVDAGSSEATVKKVWVEFIGRLQEKDVACTVNVNEEYMCISPNGKYIAVKYTDYIQEEEGVAAAIYDYPALINTETGEVKIIKTDLPSAIGLTADDNGLVFGGTPASGYSTGYVFDANDNSYLKLSEWFKQTYGIIVDDNRLVQKVSLDGKTYFGKKKDGASQSWYIKLD